LLRLPREAGTAAPIYIDVKEPKKLQILL